MEYKKGNKRPVNSFGIRTNCNTQRSFIEIFFWKGSTNRTNDISSNHSFATTSLVLKMKKNELHQNLGPLLSLSWKKLKKKYNAFFAFPWLLMHTKGQQNFTFFYNLTNYRLCRNIRKKTLFLEELCQSFDAFFHFNFLC